MRGKERKRYRFSRLFFITLITCVTGFLLWLIFLAQWMGIKQADDLTADRLAGIREEKRYVVVVNQYLTGPQGGYAWGNYIDGGPEDGVIIGVPVGEHAISVILRDQDLLAKLGTAFLIFSLISFLTFGNVQVVYEKPFEDSADYRDCYFGRSYHLESRNHQADQGDRTRDEYKNERRGHAKMIFIFKFLGRRISFFDCQNREKLV